MRPQSGYKRSSYLDYYPRNPRIELPQRSTFNRAPITSNYEYQITKKTTLLKPKGQLIKQQCLMQNSKFKQWARKGCWEVFHSSHYDWWAFPIDQSSGSKGTAYKVEQKEQKFLEQDQQFLKALKQNAILVCKSWGWDLQKGQQLKQKLPEQRWQKWPIRLSKMCRSLQIFKTAHQDLGNLFKNAIIYGVHLLEKEKKFTFGGSDLSQYFLEKHYEILKSSQVNRKIQEVNEQVPQKIAQQRFGIIKTQTQREKTGSKPSYSCYK